MAIAGVYSVIKFGGCEAPGSIMMYGIATISSMANEDAEPVAYERAK